MAEKKFKAEDTFAEADATLERFGAHERQDITGALVENMRDGFDLKNYTGFWPAELTPVKVAQHRAFLKSRGYRPLDHDIDPEIVTAAPGCEVWIRSNKAKAIANKDREDFARCEGRWDGQGTNPWGARTWKDMQRLRKVSTAHWE